jgi:hypothetical protein
MNMYLQKFAGNPLLSELPTKSHLSSGSNHDTSSPGKLGESMFQALFLQICCILNFDCMFVLQTLIISSKECNKVACILFTFKKQECNNSSIQVSYMNL